MKRVDSGRCARVSGSACGAGAPIGTRTTATAATATGAAECITVQIGHWSASV